MAWTPIFVALAPKKQRSCTHVGRNHLLLAAGGQFGGAIVEPLAQVFR